MSSRNTNNINTNLETSPHNNKNFANNISKSKNRSTNFHSSAKNTSSSGRETFRRPFTLQDDAKLMQIMNSNSTFGSWSQVASQMGDRSARQCRERWINYLSPNIRTGPWTNSEDLLLLDKVNEYGKCWTKIAQFFNGRAENDIKNRWYSHITYQVVKGNNGTYSFALDQSQLPFPDRKKRNRKKSSPAANAMRILELQGKAIQQPLQGSIQSSISPSPQNSRQPIPSLPQSAIQLPTVNQTQKPIQYQVSSQQSNPSMFNKNSSLVDMPEFTSPDKHGNQTQSDKITRISTIPELRELKALPELSSEVPDGPGDDEKEREMIANDLLLHNLESINMSFNLSINSATNSSTNGNNRNIELDMELDSICRSGISHDAFLADIGLMAPQQPPVPAAPPCLLSVGPVPNLYYRPYMRKGSDQLRKDRGELP